MSGRLECVMRHPPKPVREILQYRVKPARIDCNESIGRGYDHALWNLCYRCLAVVLEHRRVIQESSEELVQGFHRLLRRVRHVEVVLVRFEATDEVCRSETEHAEEFRRFRLGFERGTGTHLRVKVVAREDGNRREVGLLERTFSSDCHAINKFLFNVEKLSVTLFEHSVLKKVRARSHRRIPCIGRCRSGIARGSFLHSVVPSLESDH